MRRYTATSGLAALGVCLLIAALLVGCGNDHEPPDRTSNPLRTTTSTLCTPTTYEAETMYHSTGSAVTDGWDLSSDGYVATDHTFAAGAVTLTVTARGSRASGEWPHMVVSVNGTSIGDTYVSSTSWTDYTFQTTASAGTQEIRVTFDNAAGRRRHHRDLFVDKVVVSCGTSPDPCAGHCTNGTLDTACGETGVDCGDECPACPDPCANHCTNGTLDTACGETGVDCGGECPVCSSGCAPTTYDAETMYHSTGGAITGGWNLWSNGYIATDHTFTAGTVTLTVTAYGSPLAGVWPHMVVSVNGTAIGDTYVSATSWTDYTFQTTVSAGTQEIRIAFDNDAMSGSEDRNLYLDKLVVSCATAPDPCAGHCTNGTLDTACGETGVDCGGECPACPDPCANHCTNGTLDTACGETGVDCGGECPACPDPCANHCTNGTLDTACGETGVDCGGECPACPDPCANHCTNGTLDTACGETGVDCGGECAACSAGCAPTTYEAETMYHSTGGAVTGGWNLWSNGYVATDHTFSAGTVTLTVTAYGSPVAGVWPHMVVSVNGTAIGDTYVSATSWTDYTFETTVSAGTQEIRIAFDNDAMSGSEDRNLYLDKLVVSCGPPPDPCAGHCTNGTVDTACGETGVDCGGECISCQDLCAGHCTNGTLDTACGETGVDCGGECAACKATTTARIMPVGDSITLGDTYGGYRYDLYNSLTGAGYAFDFVGGLHDGSVADNDHEGYGGYTIGDIAGLIDGELAAYPPDYVLLMIGTNDVAWWSADTGATIAGWANNLITQIQTDAPDAWIIVASIPPETSAIIQPNGWDRADLTVDYNTALRAYVQARIDAGEKVRFADVYSALSLGDLVDGIHPDRTGYSKVAAVWYSALTPLLGTP